MAATLEPCPPPARATSAAAIGRADRALGAAGLHRPRDRLPARPDRSDDRLQLQQASRASSTSSGTRSLSTRGSTRSTGRVWAMRSGPASTLAFLSTHRRDHPRDAHRPLAHALSVHGPRRDQRPDLPADGDARDRLGLEPPDDVRRHRDPRGPLYGLVPRAALSARLHDDPDRPRHVQHQLRRRHGEGPRSRASTATSRRPRWTWARTSWITFWKVTFPLIFPGILAAALLAFCLSIDDFVITNFVSGHDEHVPDLGRGASSRTRSRRRSTSSARSSSSAPSGSCGHDPAGQSRVPLTPVGGPAAGARAGAQAGPGRSAPDQPAPDQPARDQIAERRSPAKDRGDPGRTRAARHARGDQRRPSRGWNRRPRPRWPYLTGARPTRQRIPRTDRPPPVPRSSRHGRQETHG